MSQLPIRFLPTVWVGKQVNVSSFSHVKQANSVISISVCTQTNRFVLIVYLGFAIHDQHLSYFESKNP